MALQLAKLAGLRVIVVADIVRNGARLVEMGADVLVDRHDTDRAIQIIRSVTKGNLRFALDTVGKETASRLQEALQKLEGGTEAQLVGLTGVPKLKVPGVRHHKVPIKVFHSAPVIGEALMIWLEELLVAKALITPDIELAQGGLSGINEALDKLRNGTVSGKRIVVPIEASTSLTPSPSNGSSDDNAVAKSTSTGGSLAYADRLNADPSRVKFAYVILV